MSTKVCKACQRALPLDLFSKKLKGLQPKCKICSAAYAKEYYKNRKSEFKEYKANKYRAERETALAKQKAYYAENKALRMEYRKRWASNNPEYAQQYYAKNAEAQRAASAAWKKSNPDACRRNEGVRRAAKRRIPEWADRALMRDIYAYARLMRAAGVGCEVDHIVPLRGKTVCGFHADNNLTVLLKEDNRRKAAKLL